MTSIATPDLAPISARLKQLRALMREAELGAVLVRSTDAFLNEYVPAATSTRAFITGFTGSMGDALITGDRALLFVDGRYTLQASRESKDYEVTTVALGTSIESGWLDCIDELRAQGVTRLGVETDRVPVSLFKTLQARADAAGVELVPTLPSLIEKLADIKASRKKKKIWAVDESLTGATTEGRLAAAAKLVPELDGYLVIPLDELAWLTNLRGDHFPYQATFEAQGLALFRGEDAGAHVAGPGLKVQLGEAKIAGATLSDLVRRVAPVKIGFSESATPEAVRAALQEAGAEMVPCENPFLIARTRKTPAELEHMADAFAKADEVVKKAAAWLTRRVSSGEKVTEADMEKRVTQLFKRSGAWGLSFKVIPAAGKNGAVIHYSKPDATLPIPEGTLFLLDTGGYYDGGYATDLTRTFLVGKSYIKPSGDQLSLFTTVLRGAIAGMSARIPVGSTGEQLDAIVRDPIWREGLNYAHGTGHGVGVNVHEFPPRVAPGVRAKLAPGQVFSIEPGYYNDEFGGIRIENLCTVVEDPDAPGFLRVKPLTFSPFDKRLIDRKRLTGQEKAFLKWFEEGSKLKTGKERLAYALPPVS